MRSSILSFVVLVLAIVQGWAAPVDSLTTNSSSIDFIDKSKGYNHIDGFNIPNGSNPNEGLINITPGGTAEQCGSNSLIMTRTIHTYDAYTGTIINSLTFPTISVGSKQSMYFGIISNYIKKYTLEIVGNANDKKMFELDAYSLNAGLSTNVKRAVLITYKPSAPGTHTVKVVIKESKNWLEYISDNAIKTCTLTVVGKAVVPNPKVIVNKTSFLFQRYSTQSFNVKGEYLTKDLKLQIRGDSYGIFSLSKTTISKTAAMTSNGVNVSVTCKPKPNINITTAYIDIYHNGQKYKTLTLTYTNNQMPLESEFNNDLLISESNEDISPEAWGAPSTGMNELSVNSRVYAEGQNVVIESSVDQRAIISDLSGHAQTVTLHTGRNEIPVNASGIYIVRIGEKTTKLMLR